MRNPWKQIAAFMIAYLILLLSGCFSGNQFPELPENPTGFDINAETYVDKNDDDASYAVIDYNGRKYLPYGVWNGRCKVSDAVKECIGYVIQDGVPDMDTRIFTVQDDDNNDFLMDYYVASNFMNQPMFFRAIDTAGKEIHIPYFIDDLGYGFWNYKNP